MLGRAPASARGWHFSRSGGQSGQAWFSHLVTSAAGWPGLEEADLCRVGGAVDEALEKELGVCGPSLGWKDVLASRCRARHPKQDGPVGEGPGHEGLPVQPRPRAYGGQATGCQTHLVGPAQQRRPLPDRTRSCSCLPGAKRSWGHGRERGIPLQPAPPLPCLEEPGTGQARFLWGTLCVCFFGNIGNQ